MRTILLILFLFGFVPCFSQKPDIHPPATGRVVGNWFWMALAQDSLYRLEMSGDTLYLNNYWHYLNDAGVNHWDSTQNALTPKTGYDTVRMSYLKLLSPSETKTAKVLYYNPVTKGVSYGDSATYRTDTLFVAGDTIWHFSYTHDTISHIDTLFINDDTLQFTNYWQRINGTLSPVTLGDTVFSVGMFRTWDNFEVVAPGPDTANYRGGNITHKNGGVVDIGIAFDSRLLEFNVYGSAQNGNVFLDTNHFYTPNVNNLGKYTAPWDTTITNFLKLKTPAETKTAKVLYYDPTSKLVTYGDTGAISNYWTQNTASAHHELYATSFDDSVGIGTNTPVAKLEVVGDILAYAPNGVGVSGYTDNGAGVYGVAYSGGIAVAASTVSGTPIVAAATPSSITGYHTILALDRLSSGTTTNNVGGMIDFDIQADDTTITSAGQFGCIITDVTHAKEKSGFEWYLTTNPVGSGLKMALDNTGKLTTNSLQLNDKTTGTSDSILVREANIVKYKTFTKFEPPHVYGYYSNNTGTVKTFNTNGRFYSIDTLFTGATKFLTPVENDGFTFTRDTVTYTGASGHIKFEVMVAISGTNNDDIEFGVFNTTDAITTPLGASALNSPTGTGNRCAFTIIAYDTHATTNDKYVIKYKNINAGTQITIFRIMLYGQLIHE